MPDAADKLIGSFRAKYPQYNDLSDQQLGARLYAKHGKEYPELKRFSAPPAASPQRAGRVATARRREGAVPASPSPAPPPRPAVNGPKAAPAARSSRPLFDPHYGLPPQPAQAAPTADTLIARFLGERPAPPPRPIRMGLAGT